MIKTHLKFLIFSIFSMIILNSCSTSPSHIIIMCAGDSITESAYPRFLQRICKKEGIKAKVLNYGRNGNNSEEYLVYLNQNKKVMSENYPDFILIQLGTNDIRMDHDRTSTEKFYKNMKNIIKIFHTFKNRSGDATKLLLATIPPVPEGVSYPFSEESRIRVTTEINPIIEKICTEEKIFLVDNYSLFLKFPQLLPEIHPSKEGYKYLAQNWFDALEIFIK